MSNLKLSQFIILFELGVVFVITFSNVSVITWLPDLIGWLIDWCLTPTLALFQLYHVIDLIGVESLDSCEKRKRTDLCKPSIMWIYGNLKTWGGYNQGAIFNWGNKWLIYSET